MTVDDIMQLTMRWFGPKEDKVSLEYIRQVPGVRGVVGALYDVPVAKPGRRRRSRRWSIRCTQPD